MQSSTQSDRVPTLLVIGARGVGKSTILNIFNSQSNRTARVEFEASNSLKGFTKDFTSDIMTFPYTDNVRLIDSPGLADPNLPIDQWVNKYNQQVTSKGWEVDLVALVIEYAERPCESEFQKFSFMNQALATVRPKDMVVVFNKCPEEFNLANAIDFFECCRDNTVNHNSKLHILGK